VSGRTVPGGGHGTGIFRLTRVTYLRGPENWAIQAIESPAKVWMMCPDGDLVLICRSRPGPIAIGKGQRAIAPVSPMVPKGLSSIVLIAAKRGLIGGTCH